MVLFQRDRENGGISGAGCGYRTRYQGGRNVLFHQRCSAGDAPIVVKPRSPARWERVHGYSNRPPAFDSMLLWLLRVLFSMLAVVYTASRTVVSRGRLRVWDRSSWISHNGWDDDRLAGA